MSKSIVESIKDFIKQEETNYALLLNGAWGSGKTHFWENNLVEEIKRIPAIQDASDKKYKTVYVSLYGLSSIIDVEKKILLNLYLNKNKIFKNEKVTKWASMLFSGFKEFEVLGVSANSFKQEKIDIPELINLNDVVLCFDDLERSSIPINDLMGFINELVEHGRAKVIIIANEEEIVNKEAYKKIKEKVIGRTLFYNPNYTEVIDSIVSLVGNEECKQILSTNINLIEKLFCNSETNNIRILKQILNDFQIIYNKIKENCEISNSRVIIEILHFTLAVSFEIRSGINGSEKFEDIDTGRDYFFLVRLTEKEVSEDWNYLKSFDLKYLLKEKNIRFWKFVETFVRNGIFDEDIFNYEINLISESVSDQELLCNAFLTQEYWHFSDEDFESLSQLIYRKIEQGEFDVYAYYAAYERFEGYINNNLFDKTKDKLIEAILNGLEKAQDNAKYREGITKEWESINRPIDKNRHLILGRIYSINDTLKSKKDEKEMLELLELISDDIHLFNRIVKDKYPDASVFHLLDSNVLMDKILKLKNIELYFYVQFMESRYEKPLRKVFEEELSVIKEFERKLEDYLVGKAITPKILLLSRLRDCINKIEE
ncbi:P-loop NTPase fold protein [Bacillus toyonensis]|uniref:P-loop NTPase fold protein n=1 Tax=Bacillus toyonensis TaxID=155322 RepID=UPI000BEC1268|nr:P-loop NTPase fold protein [Bacillus toyonensis]PEC62938.1 hypothetical protein CON62_28690 [Bacillus toyonensis]